MVELKCTIVIIKAVCAVEVLLNTDDQRKGSVGFMSTYFTTWHCLSGGTGPEKEEALLSLLLGMLMRKSRFACFENFLLLKILQRDSDGNPCWQMSQLYIYSIYSRETNYKTVHTPGHFSLWTDSEVEKSASQRQFHLGAIRSEQCPSSSRPSLPVNMTWK